MSDKISNNIPTTPNRFTRVRFDVNDSGSTFSPWGLGISFDRMAQTSESKAILCTFVKDQGWTVSPVQTNLSNLHELSDSQSLIIKSTDDGGTLQVAPNVSKKYAWRSPTELTGALTGAASGVATTGDYFLARKLPAGTDWQTNTLTADQTAWPGIDKVHTENPDNVLNPNIPIVRIASDTIMQKGVQPFAFRFLTAGAKTDSPDYLYVVYFNGPCSSELAWTGTGQYAMAIKGDGEFNLYERKKSRTTGASNPYVWRHACTGRYAPKGQVADTMHRIMVFPYTNKNKAAYGGNITFFLTNGGKANPQRKTVDLHHGGSDSQEFTYTAITDNRNPETKTMATQDTPFRISQRADLKGEFQLSYLSYPTLGFIVCDPFIFPGTTTYGSTQITVSYFADLPTGTSVTLHLFDTTATSGAIPNPSHLSETGLPIVSSAAFTGGGSYTFGMQANPGNVFTIRAELHGNTYVSPGATSQPTPTLKRLQVTVPGTNSNITATEFSIEYPATVTEVNITGPEADASHETATVNIADLGSQYSKLNTRGEFPVIIDTRYTGVDWTDSANNGKQSVLFDGYAIQSPAHRVGSNSPGAFPAADWRNYRGQLVGKWKRLHESVSTFNWDFTIDPNASEIDTPPYVVDVIKTILNWAGFTDAQIDIGSGSTSSSTYYPIRLFPRGQVNEGVAITAGTLWADFIQNLARDYLGSALMWDANATADAAWSGDYSAVKGCWRLIHPTLAPFNNLCNFVTTGPDAIGPSHYLTGYHTVSGTGSFSAQSVLKAPIFKDTLDTYVSPPEVNKVVVSGTGQTNNGRTIVAEQLTDFLVNTTSYNYNGVSSSDSNSPDYVGRERVGYKVDTVAINSPEALSWVLRRYYALTAHAVKYVSFVAPLVLVTNAYDPAQKRPRPLRFYDAVLVDGQQFIVRNVNPYYNKDDHQLAHYELQSVPPEYCVPGLMI